MHKIFKQIIYLVGLVFILILPYFVFASAPTEALESIGSRAGYEAATATSMSEIIGQIVNAFLSLLGIIFVILMLYGGYNWMTSAGDESKVETAKKTIMQAVMGLVIVASAWAIWNFMLTFLIE